MLGLKTNRNSISKIVHVSSTALLWSLVLAVAVSCSPQFNKKAAPVVATTVADPCAGKYIEITNPGTVTGCTNFTLTARLKDGCGNIIIWNGSATWTDSAGAGLSPATPTNFINGVSTTVNAQVLSAVSSVTISMSATYPASGTSTSFTVDGSAAPNFAGMGFANVHMDRSYDLFWAPGFNGCGGYAGANRYDIYEANSSAGQNFLAASQYSVLGSVFQTQAVTDPGAGATKFHVVRATSGSVQETNTQELPTRFDSLFMATMAGGRNYHNTTALNGSTRAAFIDTDSYGNLFFAHDGASSGTHSVGVLCTTQSGVCTGRTLGYTYMVSGTGGTGLKASSDTTHGLRYTYASPRGIRLDAQNNVHVADTGPNSDIVTCLTPSGLCSSIAATSIDYSGAGTAATVSKTYDGGTLAGTIDHITYDSNGNIFYTATTGNVIYVRCTTQLGWCANVAAGANGSNVVGVGGVAATVGNYYVLAGGGGGYADGGAATATSLNGPTGIAVDAYDNVVFSDTTNGRIRVVCKSTAGGMCARTAGANIAAAGVAATAGNIYLVAGSGGAYADGGAATATSLSSPQGLKMDSAGNIVFADYTDAVIRVICNGATGLCANTSGGTIVASGGAGTTANIYRLAGTASTQGYSGEGGSALSAQIYATDVALDGNNNVYFSLNPSAIYTAAGGYATSGVRNSVVRIVCMNTSGACAYTTGTTLTPGSGSVATAGNIYRAIGDYSSPIASDGIEATKGTLRAPQGVAPDASGNVVIAGGSTGKVHVVCTSNSTLCANVSGANVVTSGVTGTINNIYTVAGTGWSVNSGDGGPATSAAFYNTTSTALDSFGNVIIANYSDHTVRVVCRSPGNGVCPSTNGVGTDIVVGGGTATTAGYIYKLAGTSATFAGTGDGAAARSATLSEPYAVDVDSNDNVVIADRNNNRIRIVCMNALGPYCSSVTGGNVVAAGGAATAGFIYTLAGTGANSYSGDGGAATSATMLQPKGVAVDSNDNVAFADTANNRIRIVCAGTSGLCRNTNAGRIESGGVAATALNVYLVAGDGVAAYAGDNGASYIAEVSAPVGVGFDANDNLLVSDSVNRRVRIVCNTSATGFCLHSTGSLINASGGAATNFNIYTIAGNGSQSYSGDGYIASDAANSKLALPVHAIGDASGRLILTDSSANRVRFAFP